MKTTSVKESVEVSEELFSYYKKLIFEELKKSALKNINADRNNVILELSGKEKVFSSYPNFVPFPELTKELTDLKIRSGLDNFKHLIYGCGMIKGVIGQKYINAPLLYVPCAIDRVASSDSTLAIYPKGSVNVNVEVLATIFGIDECVPVIDEVNEILPEMPADRAALEQFLYNLKCMLPENLSCEITLDKSYLILTNIGKNTASILRDYGRIIKELDSSSDYNVLTQTSLYPVVNSIESTKMSYKVPEEELTYFPLRELSVSQASILKSLGKGAMMAVQGGPGCGKSSLIKLIVPMLLANNKKVLVVTKTSEALNVLIPENSNWWYHYCNFSSNYVSYTHMPDNIIVNGDRKLRMECANNIMSLVKCTQEIEDDFKIGDTLHRKYVKIREAVKQLHNGDTNYVVATSTVFNPFNSTSWEVLINRLKNKHILKQFKGELNLSDTHNFGSLLGASEAAVSEAISKQILMTKNFDYRQALIAFSKLLEDGDVDTNSDSYRTLFKKVLDVCPVVYSTIDDLAQLIPCEAGMFDYVIIDEASQCDIASSMPALYRGKRSVIIGDDKQLRSLSFIDRRVNMVALVRVSSRTDKNHAKFLDNSTNSLYDFANYFADGGARMLREHFRGNWKLIEYSNAAFYNNMLRVVHKGATEKELVRTDVEELPEPLVAEYVENATCTNKKACNYAEAKRVVDIVLELVRNNTYSTLNKSLITSTAVKEDPEKKRTFSTGGGATLGIVTPFRAQAELINKMLSKALEPQEWEHCDILVGTAHAFQGSERDIMIASWTLTNNSSPQAFAFVNNPNLFNVAITRARRYMLNVVSFNIQEIPDGHLKKFINLVRIFPFSPLPENAEMDEVPEVLL